jgi:D-alanyl-D-alanine carboxypeptidase (penicillin-binding protein 5/6)
MTALLAIQSGRLDQLVTVHQDAIDEVALHGGPSGNPSSAGLQLGERIPLGQLLYGLMLPSGNDAAIAIADMVGDGCWHKFVTMMNVEAYRLHLFSTHFTSPDGLIDSPEHYTTAYDLARLARYAMHLPLFAEIVSTPFYHLPRTTLHAVHSWTNTNDLLGGNPQDRTAAYSGATGIKTGHTDQAGYCLVFSATRAGHHLIGVLLYDTDTDQNQRFQDARALLDWGFSLPLRAPSM